MSLSMFLKYFLPNSLLDIHTKISVCCMSVSQLCLTFCVPMGCSPPGSSVHGFLQARILEWFAISSLQGIFLTQELNPSLLHCRQILYYLSHQGSPRKFPSTSTLKFLFLVSSQFYPCITHLTSNTILIFQNTHGASSTISDQIGLSSSGLLKTLIASIKVVFNFFLHFSNFTIYLSYIL